MHYSESLFPSSFDRISLSSSTRGRARFSVETLYRNPEVATWLKSQLSLQPGIMNVSASAITGNLLVTFHPRELTWKRILVSIQILLKTPPSKRTGQEIAKKGKVYSNWHLLSLNEVVQRTNSAFNTGLREEVVAEHQKRFGRNRLPAPTPRPESAIFVAQFQNLPIGLLIGSAALSAVTGGLADAMVILTVVFANGYIGYRMESSAQKTINSLLKVDRSPVRVVRSGKELSIDPEEVVMGDLILLVPGTLVPADARLIHEDGLAVDESILTGESLPVYKSTGRLKSPEPALADITNMVFKGTVVTSGSGRAIVVATGEDTEIGQIHRLITESTQPQTPMQRQLHRLGNQASFFSLGISSTVFVIGLIRGSRFLDLLKTSISMAVAAIPESLPTIATITVARGIKTLARQNIIIRHLDSIETLASVNTVCFDKTGTLTLNQMEATQVSTPSQSFKLTSSGIFSNHKAIDPRKHKELTLLAIVATLCNEAQFSKDTDSQQINGSSTESALLRMAIAFGMDPTVIRRKSPLLSIQYRSENKNFMITIHRSEYFENLHAVKGSPSEVLTLCTRYQKENKTIPLTPALRKEILLENEQMAVQGLRVLGFAYGTGNHDMIWLGLVGMADTLRSGIKELIAQFHAAGIETSMITGDQRSTAQTIGRQIGVGKVFARVSPSHKLKIIQEMQRAGKIVAMIGDGINDGPALKAADVGIAMAARGSEAASQAADVVLPSDNLEGMILAIREGRTIHEEIKKSIDYIISQNLSEIVFTFLSVALGGRQPFSAMQFLWINLVTDLFPELALAQEPAESDVLRKPPKEFTHRFLERKDSGKFAFESLTLTTAPFLTYTYALRTHGSEMRARSLAFLSLTASSLLYTIHARSDRLTIFDREQLARNKYIPLAIGAGFLTEIAGAVTPPLRRLLSLEQVTGSDLLLSTASGFLPLLIMETSRFINKRI